MRTSLFLLITFVVMAVSVTAQNLEWSKMIGSLDGDYGYALKELSNGDIVILGEVSEGTGDVNSYYGNLDVWVARLTSAGDFIWKKNLGGSNTDFARSISVDQNDNIYVAGWTYSNDFDITFNTSVTHKNSLYKLNSNGELQWVKNYSVPNEDRTILYHVNVLGENKIFLSGYAEYIGNSNHDTHNLLIDTEGDIIWENFIPGYVDGSSSEIDSDGNIYCLTQEDRLIKFNSNGNVVWNEVFFDGMSSLYEMVNGPINIYWDNNNLVFVDQILVEEQTEYFDTRLFRIDTNGNLMSVNSLITNYFGYEDFLNYENSNLILLGRIGTGLPGDANSGIISISNSVQINYNALNNGGTGWDRLVRGILHSSGSIMAIGKSNSNDGDCENSVNPNADDDDIWLVKFSDDLGVEKTEITKSSIFPNPAKDHIEVKLFNNEQIEEVLIYNQFGALISSNTSSPIDISNLNNGIYFLKILSKNGKVLVDKLEVIK